MLSTRATVVLALVVVCTIQLVTFYLQNSRDASNTGRVLRVASLARAKAGPKAAPAAWEKPPHNLVFNAEATALLETMHPKVDTMHFTFGSQGLWEFLINWRHHHKQAGLPPPLVGAADVQMLARCTESSIAATGLRPELDVWNYTLRDTTSQSSTDKLRAGSTEWKYYRHHKSAFLEIGLVKIAFLWEMLQLGFDVLISDLDIVWMSPHWERWMTYRQVGAPVAEAALMAMADVLVSTDELNDAEDRRHSGFRVDLNTGVLFFRATNGSKAFIQGWRLAMLAKQHVSDTNDQFIFCQLVQEARVAGVLESPQRMAVWREQLRAHSLSSGQLQQEALENSSPATRDVRLSELRFSPCVSTTAQCTPEPFSIATLPLRAFSGGHTYFFQHLQEDAHHEHPSQQLVTLHFTFQYGDILYHDYPYGKRQRAREAGVWAADPPEYFTGGRFLKVNGDLFSAEQRISAERLYPEWAPQRHLTIDAPQRAAVRDALALAIALNASLIMPDLYCFCDRYWGFTHRCRFPDAPKAMRLPFRCSMDSLYDVTRWATKGVHYREAAFLDHPNVPRSIRDRTVQLKVSGQQPAVGSASSKFTAVVPHGTAMHEIGAALEASNPTYRVAEVSIDDLRSLCRWLGSDRANRDFNTLARYVLTDSCRFCPSEDHRWFASWDWKDPFTAYNCTWGFHYPTPFPETAHCGVPNGHAWQERPNSTTCPRQMLCGWDTHADGSESGTITYCNVESKGYGGTTAFKKQSEEALAKMPNGRCPYPPLDRPGPGPGFDPDGRWVGGDADRSGSNYWVGWRPQGLAA